MKKGFLCGPVAKKEEKVVNESEPTKATGAVPKVKVDVGKKRRRTRSKGSSLSPSPGRGFFVPGFSREGEKSMSLTELLDASKGLSNMALAHEIAVDKDFSLQKIQPANEVEKQVKELMQRAFWELLSDQLAADPPQYSQALTLLTEIKGMLFSILMPQHAKLKEKIEAILDIDLIQQQIDNDTLEFEKYAGYILGLMGMLCAPVRDERLAELKEMTEVVPLFRGIMELLEQMKLDMANFTIQQVRPVIVSQSVTYEQLKFREWVEAQEDGLGGTRQWLTRHAPQGEDRDSDVKYRKLQGHRILTDAFTELLQWDEFYSLPETLVMDQKRIFQLRDKVERVSVSTAVILLAFSNLNSVIIPQDSQQVKETIKKHIDILLQDFNEDDDLLAILPNVAVQVVKDVNDYLEGKKKDKLGEALVEDLTKQIVSLEDPNQRIRDLLQKRIVDFCKQAISGNTKNLQVPPGLTICKSELGDIAGHFVRLVNYNKSVFGEFYNEIIENHCIFKVEA